MKTVYNTAVGYERMKYYSAMVAFIIIGIILIIVTIMSIANPPADTPPNPPSNTPETNTPSTTPPTSSKLSWPWILLIGITCFLIAYGCYYMASTKSMENVLAAQGAIDTVNFIRGKGGRFDIGE